MYTEKNSDRSMAEYIPDNEADSIIQYLSLISKDEMFIELAKTRDNALCELKMSMTTKQMALLNVFINSSIGAGKRANQIVAGSLKNNIDHVVKII